MIIIYRQAGGGSNLEVNKNPSGLTVTSQSIWSPSAIVRINQDDGLGRNNNLCELKYCPELGNSSFYRDVFLEFLGTLLIVAVHCGLAVKWEEVHTEKEDTQDVDHLRVQPIGNCVHVRNSYHTIIDKYWRLGR